MCFLFSKLKKKYFLRVQRRKLSSTPKNAHNWSYWNNKAFANFYLKRCNTDIWQIYGWVNQSSVAKFNYVQVTYTALCNTKGLSNVYVELHQLIVRNRTQKKEKNQSCYFMYTICSQNSLSIKESEINLNIIFPSYSYKWLPQFITMKEATIQLSHFSYRRAKCTLLNLLSVLPTRFHTSTVQGPEIYDFYFYTVIQDDQKE